MTAVEGEPVRGSVRREGPIYDEQPVGLRFADAHFYNFSPGKCTVVARHPSLNPLEAEREVELAAGEALIVRYFYLEPERQLLRIQVTSERLDT